MVYLPSRICIIKRMKKKKKKKYEIKMHFISVKNFLKKTFS